MGRLEEVLAAVDNARRVVGRNASDLFNDPAGHLTKITDALRNTNASVAPVASNGELTNRPLSPAERAEQTMGSLDFGGGLGVIKPKGGNWLSGQVEDALRGLRKNPENIRVAAGPNGPERTRAAKTSAEALNQWIEGPLTKYIKRDMGAPSDPIRALAEQGILHYTPEPARAAIKAEGARKRRLQAGMPLKNAAQTPLGQAWENQADLGIYQRLVSDFNTYPDNLRNDPWLATTDPSSKVSVLNRESVEYGVQFSHLVDELANSLREGRLRPEQLTSGNLSVEGAVRHVAEINALRAKKAEEALQADMAGMPLHKDYPEQGYSWRQLQHEDEDQLQKWLTQEGDAMGHCVGGYCPDVKEGRSSIYSLRDAKGKPHVTIETQPYNWKNGLFEASRRGNAIDEMFGDRASEIRKAFNESPFNNIQQFLEKNPEYLPQKQSIIQIKGKGNAKPAGQYLPFVQDFIRSGKWSEIQDAQNTGLTPEEINQLLGR